MRLLISHDKSELNNVILTKDRRLHIAGHMSSLSLLSRICFLLNGVGFKKLSDQLKIPGSKFFPDFCTSPSGLFNLIKNKIIEKNIEYTWKNDRCEISLDFCTNKYSDGIGTDGLLPVEKIPEDKKKDLKKIKRSENSSYEIYSIILDKPIPTWKANMVLIRKENSIELITIFPGTYAPPLPDKKFHSGGEYKEYDEFWNKNALIRYY